MNEPPEPSPLLLIDAIGPFFRHYDKKRINWSKIPFDSIETEDGIQELVLQTVPEDFRRFAEHVSKLGYTAVTLDDIAHLIPSEFYDDALNRKIDAYRRLYQQLMEIAESLGLRVFFTMDVMFFHPSLKHGLRQAGVSATEWLKQQLRLLFQDHPLIAGVIMRIGESDGVDVRGDFRSELYLKRPKQARDFLREMLPVFESESRCLIFRTWTVGAHPIGDLGWNEKRFHQVFRNIDSPNLIISFKYGESDFFRYLTLNPLFSVSDHQKIIEFQARREYEGFGAYPSFVGWDVEQYLADLRDAKNVVGASVWCQTGGWGKRRQLTYLRNSSVWVELNTHVIAKLWSGSTCDQAIESFVRHRLPDVPTDVMREFLCCSDRVILDLLYVRELAERRLYFRRLRLPPQLFVFWDRILIDGTIAKVLGCLVRDSETAILQAREAFEQLQQMVDMAEQYGIPQKGLKLQLATFEILAVAREYFFLDDKEPAKQKLIELKRKYRKRFKRSYSVTLNFEESPAHRIPWRLVLAMLVRDKRKYRLVDRVVVIQFLGMMYPIASRFRDRIGPRFASQQAMGLDALLK